jgi:hypothetical protein
MNAAAMFAPIDTDKLVEEIDRYLTAIDLFRALGCEPTWRPESHAEAVSLERSLRGHQEHRVVH